MVWVLVVSLDGSTVVTLEIATEECVVGLDRFVVVS